MSYMTSEQCTKSHAIIHSASLSAGAVGAGLAQIPCSDNLAISPRLLVMTSSLGRVFGIDLSESSAKTVMASAAATAIGRTAEQVLVGWIPLVGNAINAATATSHGSHRLDAGRGIRQAGRVCRIVLCGLPAAL